MKIEKKTGLPLNDDGTYPKGVDRFAYWREEIKRRSDVRREERKGLFLAEYAHNGYHMSRAAKAADVTLRAIEYWLKDDPDFRQACDEILAERSDDLEGTLYERATDPKSRDGTTAAIMLLNGYRPEVFKGKGGDPSGGGSVTINFIIGAAPAGLPGGEAKRLPAQTGNEITLDGEVEPKD